MNTRYLETGAVVQVERVGAKEHTELFVIQRNSAANPTTVGADSTHTVDEYRFIKVKEVPDPGTGKREFIPTGATYVYYTDFPERCTISFSSVKPVTFADSVWVENEERKAELPTEENVLLAALSKVSKKDLIKMLEALK